MPLSTRVAVGGLGIAGVVGGALLIAHASAVNESRIARLAGLLIVLGIAGLAAAVFGWR
jgi:hypothetical protein